jgi:hypothetical protein
VLASPSLHRRVSGHTGSGELQYGSSSPSRLPELEQLLGRIGRHPDWIVVGPEHPREGIDEDQRPGSLRIGSSEYHGHRAALRITDQGRPFGARSVHHHAGVICPLLKRRKRT